MTDIDHPTDIMEGVIEPDEVGTTPEPAKPTFLIQGQMYELASYGEPYEDGSRHATIRLITPF